MSSINPNYRTVTQLLQRRSYSIDEYQREYKWEQKNIEELISDLLGRFETSYRDGDEVRAVSTYTEYFLGSIIVTNRGQKSYLVDGQQRLTSLTLLLIYLFRAAKELDLSLASTLEPLIYSDSYGEQKFNLDISERVPTLRALFNGETVVADTQEESAATLIARYRDIETLDLKGELGDRLPHFIYWFIERVGLIEIATDSDSHAYSIFETMNDRGKPLSPVDMLKAYLLAPLTDGNQRSDANRIWKRTVLELNSWEHDPDPERDVACIKAWLRAKYADSTRDRKSGAADKDWELIGSVFHRWMRDNEKQVGSGNTNRNFELLTAEFPFFARAYRLILEASHQYTPGLESVYYNAHNDFTWQTTVLLAPLTREDTDDILRRKVEAVAAYLDIWIMRRAVNYIRVGYSSVSYAMFLLCRDIRDLPLQELIDVLQRKLDSDEVSFEGSEEKNRYGISYLGLNQSSRRYIFHLLARVTAYVERESGRPDLFAEYTDRKRRNGWDIEHIWADKYHRYASQFEDEQQFDAWRNSASALVLLPADVNRSLQDAPFKQKAASYSSQNLYAASLTSSPYKNQPQFDAFIHREGLEFRPCEEFTTDDQLERESLLLELALRIWSPDRLTSLREA